MTQNYLIIAHDTASQNVVVRWQDGDWASGANFRDELYALLYVVPGAARTFADMQLPFDYDAALAFVQRMAQSVCDAGTATICPPDWPSDRVFQGTIAKTPVEYIPAQTTAA